MSNERCILNAAVRDALREAGPAYGSRRIQIVLALDATEEALRAPDALYEAVHTLFRGLPARLPLGTTLRIQTRDLAGGDAELAWEAVEGTAEGEAWPTPEEALREGPFGDLFDVALRGLARLCRSRSVLAPVAPSEGGAPRRRYTFLVPSAAREA